MKCTQLIGLFFVLIVVQLSSTIILRSWKLFEVTLHHGTNQIDLHKRSQDEIAHADENMNHQNPVNASWQSPEIPHINMTHLEDVKQILARPRQRDPHLDTNMKPEVEYDVPERLHFIWIGSQIPLKYIKHVESFRKQNKQYEIYLWVDNSFSLQMLQNQSFQVQKVQTSLLMNKEIYDQETNYGAKSDILRYELVFQYGGIYFDIDSAARKPLDGNFRKAFAIFSPGYRNLSNAIFGFAKNSSFLHFVLKSLPAHYKAFRKEWIPSRTGPAYFTSCFLRYNDNRINLINKAFVFDMGSKSYTYHTSDANWMKHK